MMKCIRDFIVNFERKNVELLIDEQLEFVYDLACQTGTMGDDIHIYSPWNGSEPKGFIIDIHGGGLIAGTALQNESFCRWVANSGYKVFSIDYPLIPEVTFIEQVESIIKAIKKISKSESDWNKIGKSKFLFGDSAGALLALVTLGLTSPKEQVRKDFGIAAECVEWDGVWLQSPMIYTTQCDAIGLIMSKIYYGKGWKKQPWAKYIKDPIWYLVHDYPDVVLFSSSFKDDLMNHTSKAIMEMCEFRGLAPKCFCTDNPEHDANVLFPWEEDSEKVNESAIDFLEKYFKEKMLGKSKKITNDTYTL